GFGGSCLPKDLRALNFVARDLDIATPLLNSVLGSNDAHIVRVVDAVLETGKRRVALLGLSFKNGSDDLRESPFVRLAEALIGRGLMLRVCDPDVAISQLIGRNRAFIEERLPHVAQLLSSEWETVTRDSDVVIVGKRLWDPARLAANLHEGQTVIDLVGIESLGPAVRPWAASSANGGRVESLVPPIGR
ncbi:MAG: UDP binding domain-containing protein, partial [Acidobacteriota bacterium]